MRRSHHYSPVAWASAHRVRTSGPRGRVRYRMHLRNGSVISAGLFGTIVEAIRHAHRTASKCERLVDARLPRVGTERWLWRAGDLEELAAEVGGGTGR